MRVVLLKHSLPNLTTKFQTQMENLKQNIPFPTPIIINKEEETLDVESQLSKEPCTGVRASPPPPPLLRRRE